MSASSFPMRHESFRSCLSFFSHCRDKTHPKSKPGEKGPTLAQLPRHSLYSREAEAAGIGNGWPSLLHTQIQGGLTPFCCSVSFILCSPGSSAQGPVPPTVGRSFPSINTIKTPPPLQACLEGQLPESRSCQGDFQP